MTTKKMTKKTKSTKTMIMTKMTGGTPEVRSDKSFTILTFDICYLTFNQLTNGPVDKKFLRPYEKKNTLEHWNF